MSTSADITQLVSLTKAQQAVSMACFIETLNHVAGTLGLVLCWLQAGLSPLLCFQSCAHVCHDPHRRNAMATMQYTSDHVPSECALTQYNQVINHE